jgi:hypothetical protein
MTVASRILGVTKSSIHRSWRKEGIKANVPDYGDWRRYNQVNRGWWGGKDAEDGWMQQHREAFPDWSSVWDKERVRRNSSNYVASYYKMSAEERRANNAKIWQRKKARYASDDEYAKTMRDYSAAWKKRNPLSYRESRRKAIAKRRMVDPGFRVQSNLRNRFKELMGTTRKGGSDSASSLIGCSTRQLAAHLESKFTKRMSWANYGTYWHVDHILPCASFDHNDPKQRAQCWHWTNLRPLEAKKNMDKSDSITNPQMSLLLCATH